MTRKRFASAVIWLHLGAAALHGAAHGSLNIQVGGTLDLLVVAGAVYMGPLIALAGIARNRTAVGGLLLFLAMAAALIYGVAFHFVLQTPDNVAFLPHGAWSVVFRATAVLIAVLEALGVVAGALLLSDGSKAIHVRVTRPVAAPAGRAYAVLADYRRGHPRILPRAFHGLTVEEGGVGAGTVIRFGMRSFGSVRWVRAVVEEPEPGRVLVERILDESPVETRFTVDPVNGDRASVSIESTWTPTGLRAAVERLLAPYILERVFVEELGNLERIATEESAGA